MIEEVENIKQLCSGFVTLLLQLQRMLAHSDIRTPDFSKYRRDRNPDKGQEETQRKAFTYMIAGKRGMLKLATCGIFERRDTEKVTKKGRETVMDRKTLTYIHR